MTSKIFRSTLLVAVIVLLCSLSLIIGILYPYFEGILTQQLSDELSLVATGMEESGIQYLEKVEARQFRITWIDEDGTVLYDTRTTAQDMENHSDREEFREALGQSRGSSTRYSNTLTEKTFYEAKRLNDGTVLRVSVSQASSWTLLVGMFHPIAAVAILAVILSAVLSRQMARRIVQPLNTLDLDHPLDNNCYEEMIPLLHRINQQRRQITSQMNHLKQKTDEFLQISSSMQEGLVLLDKNGIVLHINPAAQMLFQISREGVPFFASAEDKDLEAALAAALEQGHSSLCCSRGGRIYQFDLNRIGEDEQIRGVVLLAFDMTERQQAEQTRREFSANVSHELKTPLQSIIGSAELLESGLVKPEDAPRFLGHIRKEATRLVDLIGDIIRLSALDEGIEMPTEEVALLALAEEVKQQLQAAAQEKGVTVWVHGEECVILGVRRFLEEMLYNLCDNAIKYNVAGGSVKIHAFIQQGHPVLTVSDTGIGIAPEHQERIFERFYRVDKSHSRLSGGTGLGLSIVKHAAQYHKAELSLESTPEKGTTITIRF